MAWLSTWAKRRKITVDNTNIDSDLTHFPVPIVLGTSVGQSSQDVSDIFDELDLQDVNDDFTGTDSDDPNINLWKNSGGFLVSNKVRFTGTSAKNCESIFKVSGDFDIQVDMNAVIAPSTATWEMYFRCRDDSGVGAIIGKKYDASQGHRINNFALPGWTQTATYSSTVTELKLRFVRVGTTLTGYYDIGAGWVSHGSATVSLDKINVAFACNAWGTPPTYAADFDNFIVNSGTIVWPENTNPNRKKIALTKDDGTTEIYGEIEHWDQVNEKAVIWVSKSDLVLTTALTTDLYLYYDPLQDDNDTYIGETTDTVAQYVWDDNYKAVYHMAQDPNGDVANSILDSTINVNHGTPSGTMLTADLVDGEIGKAIDLDASDDELQLPKYSSTEITLEVALRIDNAYRCNIWLQGIDANNADFWFGTGSSNALLFGLKNGGTQQLASDPSALSTGEHFLAGNYNSGTINLFRDTTKFTNALKTISPADTGINKIGIWNGNSGFGGWADIVISEARLSNIARPEDWIKAVNYSLIDDLITFASAEDIVLVDDPIIDISSGEYLTNQLITLSCITPGCSIYYTKDGTDPDSTDNLYAYPITIFEGTLKVIAYLTGNYSNIVTATYTLSKVSTPVVSLATGQYSINTLITINVLGGGDIYYTLDGSTPTELSNEYFQPISMFEGTLKVYAVKTNYIDSDVVTVTYTLSVPSSWDEARNLGAWAFTPTGADDKYNEGNLIASVNNPVWSIDRTKVAITPGHDPCGYWTKGYIVPPPPETGYIYGTGLNNSGQLSVGDKWNRNDYTLSSFSDVEWKKIVCGGSTTVAMKEDGSLWGCGYPYNGALGIPIVDSSIMHLIHNGPFIDFSCLKIGLIAIKEGGEMWGSGINSFGELGLGHNNSVGLFTKLNSEVWSRVFCASDYSYAVKSDGSVWSTGLNGSYQLGLGHGNNQYSWASLSSNVNNPPIVSTNPTDIALSRYTAQILISGNIYVAGDNFLGSAGAGVGAGIYTYFQPILGNWYSLVPTGGGQNNHSAVMDSSGNLYITGRNLWGELGLGDKTTRYEYTDTGLTVKAAYIGEFSTFAILTDGTLWSAGYNDYGTLGLNNNTQSIISFTQEYHGYTDWMFGSAGTQHSLGIREHNT